MGKLAFLIIIFHCFTAGAEVKVPVLQNPVTDRAELLSASFEREVNSILTKIWKEGGAQIAVLTISSLEGEPIETFSLRVVDQWKLGHEHKDNGVLILVAAQEKKVRIEIGQGLEGDLPDSLVGRIIDYKIIPSFKQGRFEEGIRNGVQQVIYSTGDQIEGAQELSEPTSKNRVSLFSLILFLILFFTISIFRGPRRIGSSRSSLKHALRGGYRRHHWSGGFGGGIGGRSSGGFGGGGGGFSGGGASGGW